MASLLIAISGCGGGSKGPQDIYPLFQKFSTIENFSFVAIDTKPNDIQENVERTCHVAKQFFDSTENIYLMGYSMGGAIAVQAAQQLIASSNKIKGIVLLSTQTDHLYPLRHLGIPVLFCHGTKDDIFPLWQIESTYEGCLEPKKMVEIQGVSHDLALEENKKKSKQYSEIVAKAILDEMANAFIQAPMKGQNRVSITLPEIKKERNVANFLTSLFLF